VRFEELAEQVANLSKSGYLDAESIVEVKRKIASCPSTTLLVKKIAEAAPPVLLLSPPTSGHCVRDPSPSPLLEYNDKEERQSPSPRHRQLDAPEYSEDDRPELVVGETQRYTHLFDSQMFRLRKRINS
jgi:hypothetical protein